MDWVNRLNDSLKYIEDNLEQKISFDYAAKLACCSTYHYQRMFSFMSDISLSEYIRNRRLTLAAIDLQKGDSKVIEVSLKYGYSSPTAFTRAFVSLHEITPSQAKESGAKLKLYPPISFNISIKGGVVMDYRIEDKKGFRLVGKKETVSLIDGYNFKRIPSMWDEVIKNGDCQKILSLSNAYPPGLMGACANCIDNELDYYIASSSDKELPEGMNELIVPPSTWAVFECRGMASIQPIWKKIYTDWFPTSGYEHSGGAEIEWYSDGDTSDKDYLTEIWIPIIKK